ncbi:hypothetical protein, partial [Nostoc sp.]|uniref:hypothetical protein n=1 Tax=Nostoc sp. TaxID=1180 RepID=UPI002FF47DBD
MSTTGYAYAFSSTFKLRITAKIRFSTAIAFLFDRAMSTTCYAYALHYTFKLIAIASIVRTKVVEHALLRLVNNQRYPDICGC